MLIHGLADNDLHPPRFGGTQRAFGLFRGLARAHPVQVLCVVPNRNRSPREEVVAGVTLIRRKAWYTSMAWRLDRLGVAPLQSAAELHNIRARRLLRALPGRPDVLAAEFGMTGGLGTAGAKLDVYLSQNVEADFFATTSSRLLLGGWWSARVRARERRAVERAGVVVVVSEDDAARMVALHGADPARIEVIPNGYDETAIRPPSRTERERARAALGLRPDDYAALFVGSDAPHNHAAARLLVEEVGPRLADAGIVTIVAGSVCRGLGAGAAGLRLLGEVADLLPVLHAADAGLNPVLEGGGSNVKLPTYLAAGLAAISTPFGVRGYASLAPLAAIAEPTDFAAAIATKPRGWSARGESMPSGVADHAWGRLGALLGDRLAKRLDAPAAGAVHSHREAVA